MANTMLPSGVSVRIREDLIDGASRVQTTLTVDPIVTLDGHRVEMVDIGAIGFGKLDGGNAREEIFSWTGITDNTTTYTLTGCTWGLNFYDLNNSTDNYRRHTSGAVFEIKTDMHYVADQFVSRYTPEVEDDFIPTEEDHLTTKEYVDNRNGYWEGAVANYAALPTGDTDGEARITLDDSKMYVWDTDTTTWTLTGAGGGAGTVYITTQLGSDAVGADSRTFQLDSGSFPSDVYLQVYINGTLMELGASEDYTTATSNKAIFNYDVLDTDKITMLVVSVDIYNPEWNNVNADVLPTLGDTYNIGSTDLKFLNYYGDGSTLDDGTLGKLTSIDPDNITAQSAASLIGDTDIVTTDFDTLGQGANDGAFKTTIDGTEYDNLAIDSLDVGTISTLISNATGSTTQGLMGQSFTTVTNQHFVTSITCNYYGYPGTETGVLTLYSGSMFGTEIGSKSLTQSMSGYNQDIGVTWTFDTPVRVEQETQYFFMVTGLDQDFNSTSSSTYDGGVAYQLNGSASTNDLNFTLAGADYGALTETEIASELQTAIRTATSGTETVEYDTDHFVVTSTTLGKNNGGEVLQFTAPTIGTDITVAGYLDLGVNATEVDGDGDDGKLVRLDDAGIIPAIIVPSAYFGDGSDGVVIIPSGTTTLTSDMQYLDLIIEDGGILKPNGFRVYVNRTLTLEGSGHISANGGDGSQGYVGVSGNGTTTTGGAGGTAANTVGTLPASLAGAKGANGATNGGTAAVGTDGVDSVKGLNSSNSASSGIGGDGNETKVAAGADGTDSGTISNPLLSISDAIYLRDFPSDNARFQISPTSGGAGGGGKGGSSGYTSGGAGGGSGATGGIVWVEAREIITVTATDFVDVSGGDGGDAGEITNSIDQDTYRASGGGGGGAGGNGGVAFVLYKTISGTGTVNISAGAGGALGLGQANTGTGGAGYNGTAGTAGTAGNEKLIQVV